jgi:hypothetical protein
VLLARHLSRLVASIVRYGITGRRIGLLVAIVLGAVAVTLAAASSAAVPIVVYPFV